MMSTSSAFCPCPLVDYPGAHELRIWAFGIHFLLEKEVFPDLQRVYFKLVAERTWSEGLVKGGVLRNGQQGSFVPWIETCLAYVKVAGRRVDVVFEYEWVDGRWYGVDERGEIEGAEEME
jgi:hypothetical protein